MRQEFSTSWIASKQPRKQRKFRYNAPLHVRAKFLSAHLSDTLSQKHNQRTAVVRKGDEVVVMRGEFKKKNAKVTRVDLRKGRIYLDAATVTKKDGTKVEVPVQPSNVQIITLVDDKFRFAKAKEEKKEEKAKPKSENKQAKEKGDKK